ncbi:MAG: hypothetical protein JWN56_2384 [Sphingobacteriales bacterium]|nr:hypothetical protein [Sphingobacteriales bacterium]
MLLLDSEGIVLKLMSLSGVTKEISPRSALTLKPLGILYKPSVITLLLYPKWTSYFGFHLQRGCFQDIDIGHLNWLSQRCQS